MTNQIIYCEKSCGKDFTMPELQTIPMTDGIEKNCFFCPWCGHEYVSFYTDAEIRGLHGEINDLRFRMGNKKKLMARHDKLKKKIKNRMVKLNPYPRKHPEDCEL